MQRGPFTWEGGLNNHSQVRLDWFLVRENLDKLFNQTMQYVLPRSVSDHFPILLDGGGLRRGPSSFRFEKMWLEEEGFKDLPKNWWEGFIFNDSRSFVLDAKLRFLKAVLKS